MKNRYEVRGNEAIIFLPFRGAELQTVIDLADLPRVQELPGTWYANPAKAPAGKFYALGKLWDRRAGRSRTVMLHRWIIDIQRGLEAHHVDNDGLNNRRSNVQQLTHQGNIRERWPGRDWEAEASRLTSRRHAFRLARDLRAQAGVSRQTIWLWVTGRAEAPSQYVKAVQAITSHLPQRAELILPPGMTAKQYAKAKVWS